MTLMTREASWVREHCDSCEPDGRAGVRKVHTEDKCGGEGSEKQLSDWIQTQFPALTSFGFELG